VARIETCSLTFDDGPDPTWTTRLLDCLHREGVRCTFFVIAGRASSHPALIARMLTEGHEVAFHCVRHVRHSEISEPALRRDTEQGLRTLAGLGASPRRWRAPWGVITSATRSLAALRELELVGWSADTEDWRGDPAAQMHARVQERIAPGAVVLMHDGLGPGARRSGCHETLELVPRLLDTVRRRGLRATPLASGDGSERSVQRPLRNPEHVG